MVRPLDPTLVDHAVDLYLAGQTIPKVAAELRIGASTLSRELRKRGIEARGIRLSLSDDEIARRHEAGESVLSIANDLGVSRNVIDLRLREAGIATRSQREAQFNRAAKMTREERCQLTAAAHEAVRGVPQPEERLERSALAREKNPRAMSRHERQFRQWLRERNVSHVREKAVGRYNVDFAVPPIAVEILGGEWHNTRVKAMIHGRRTPYLLDSGWSLLFVWATPTYPLTPAVADYLVANLDEAARDPALIGEYRVIRGDAKLLARGRREDYERTGIVPARDH